MEIPKSAMLEWTIETTNQVFSDWANVGHDDKLRMIKQLREIGKLTASSIKIENKELVCSVYGFPVVKPCSLSRCRNHISNQDSKNCAVILLEQSKNSRVPNAVISKVFGISCSDLTKIHAKATNKIKYSLLRERLQEINPYSFRYIPKHCVSCGQSMHEEWEYGISASHIIEQNNWGYCSDQCKQKKPKWMFNIEHQFGYHYTDILSAAMSIYRDPVSVDQMLNLPNGITQSYVSRKRRTRPAN